MSARCGAFRKISALPPRWEGRATVPKPTNNNLMTHFFNPHVFDKSNCHSNLRPIDVYEAISMGASSGKASARALCVIFTPKA